MLCGLSHGHSRVLSLDRYGVADPGLPWLPTLLVNEG